MQQFRNRSVVLTGPELSPSWGDWVVFPLSLQSPGDSVAGTIRVLQAGFGVPDLALLSARDIAAIKPPIYPPQPLHADEPWEGEAETQIVEAMREESRKKSPLRGASVSLPEKLTRGQLSSGQRVKFHLERLSGDEFSFVLGSGTAAEFRIICPEGDAYWGITVSRGGDVEVTLD
jgi:hypothetical protein